MRAREAAKFQRYGQTVQLFQLFQNPNHRKAPIMPRAAESTEAPPAAGMSPVELVAWLRNEARDFATSRKCFAHFDEAADLIERAYPPPREREDIVRRGQEVLDEIATGTYQGAIPAAEEVSHDPR